MSDAYKCDHCDDYHDGDPAERLYVKQANGRQGMDYVKAADLCRSCKTDILGDETEEDNSVQGEP